MKSFLRFLLLIFSAGLVYSAVHFYDVHVKIPELEELGEFESARDVVEEMRGEKGAGLVKNDVRVDSIEDASIQPSQFTGSIDDIISLANEARKEKNVSPLKRNDQLMESALIKARDMRDNDYFEHVSPSGLDMSYFVNKTDYNYSSIGENLAEGYFSAESVHVAWMESEGHRKNIMSSDFEEIGIAVVEVERDGVVSFVSVQHFGTQFKDNQEFTTVVICEEKVKDECNDAEERREKIKDVIEEQEEIIDKAKDEGYSDKDLRDLYENLENLDEVKDDLKDYIRECEEFIQKCDQWE